MGPSGARDVQEAAMRLSHLGPATLKLSEMQILREKLDLAGCWNTYILGVEDKVKEFRGKFFLRCTFELLGPWSW